MHLILTSGDICLGLENLNGSPSLPTSSPARIGILRFACGATPTDHCKTYQLYTSCKKWLTSLDLAPCVIQFFHQNLKKNHLLATWIGLPCFPVLWQCLRNKMFSGFKWENDGLCATTFHFKLKKSAYCTYQNPTRILTLSLFNGKHKQVLA